MDKAMYIYLHQHNLLYDYYPKERNGESFLKKWKNSGKIFFVLGTTFIKKGVGGIKKQN